MHVIDNEMIVKSNVVQMGIVHAQFGMAAAFGQPTTEVPCEQLLVTSCTRD